MLGLERGWMFFPILNLMVLPILTMVAIYPALAKQVQDAKGTTQMTLSSPAFLNGKGIPAKFSCDGEGISPPLTIQGVPKEAKSLALVMDDPDAPAGVWVHWLVWNIDPAIKQIGEGSLPPGAGQGVNSWERRSYGGPCPPSGTHRYYFRLFALKERLDLPQSANRKDLDGAMQGKIVARCEMFGVYSRK
jgi:Raf kinase inhibitor-like YbhB/YbcL family protein